MTSDDSTSEIRARDAERIAKLADALEHEADLLGRWQHMSPDTETLLREAAAALRLPPAGVEPETPAHVEIEGLHGSTSTASDESRTLKADASARAEPSVSSVQAKDGAVDRARDIPTDSDLSILQGQPIAAGVEAGSPLRALIARWRERQAIALPEYEGNGYGACADELDALLSAPVASAEEKKA